MALGKLGDTVSDYKGIMKRSGPLGIRRALGTEGEPGPFNPMLNIRGVAGQLRPVADDPQGFDRALDELTAAVSKADKAALAMETDGPDAYKDVVEVQEALGRLLKALDES